MNQGAPRHSTAFPAPFAACSFDGVGPPWCHFILFLFLSIDLGASGEVQARKEI
jgi:hypothetical protein